MAATLTTHSLTVAKPVLAFGTPDGCIRTRIELRGVDPALVEECAR